MDVAAVFVPVAKDQEGRDGTASIGEIDLLAFAGSEKFAKNGSTTPLQYPAAPAAAHLSEGITSSNPPGSPCLKEVVEVLAVEKSSTSISTSTSTSTSTTLGTILDPTFMDPALWRQMPMHIVELILSKVPFKNLVTMRRVCKYWNELILSDGFCPPFVPALIMFARTPTVRKMMLERNQPEPVPVVVQEKVTKTKWKFLKVWRLARRLVKRKRYSAKQ